MFPVVELYTYCSMNKQYIGGVKMKNSKLDHYW